MMKCLRGNFYSAGQLTSRKTKVKNMAKATKAKVVAKKPVAKAKPAAKKKK